MVLWTSRSAYADPLRKNSVMARSLLLGFCLFLLSACSPDSSLLGSSSNSSNTAENKAGQDKVAPLIVPPGKNNMPLQPGQSGVQYMPDGMPALQPAKGINYETLFDARIKDDDKRFDRLENAVTDLRREFEAVKPAVVRLVAVEGDIQNLIQELEVLLQNEPPSSPAVNSAPPAVTAEIAPPTQLGSAGSAPPTLLPSGDEPSVEAISSPAISPSGTADAKRLRFGEHKDKTRVVIDMSKAIAYKVDLDNAEKLLVIDLPKASWGGKTASTVFKSPLVTSYTVQPTDEGGSRVILLLKRSTSVMKQSVIKPNADSRSHRLVIDLKK